MSNITISGLPPATLPLDGPNSFFEVQTIEAGVNVSRRIAADDINLSSAIIIEDEGVPLAGGADTLNFVGLGVTASGAGSTKTITIPGGGQVNTVVGGVNISVNPADPVNPVVNLDAVITGMTVNGVVLSNAGAATNYLDETGAYSLPSGSGQVDSVVGGTNISVNAADPVNPIVNLDAAITGVSVNGVTLSNAGAATDYLDETGAYSAPPAGSGVITFEINADINTATPPTTEAVTAMVEYLDLAGDDSLGFVGYNSGNDLQVQNRMQSGEVILRGEDLGGVQRLGVRLNFDSGGESYIAGFTTVAMRFMTGNEYAVLATLNAGVDLRWDNVGMARTVAIGSGGFEVNNTVTGAGFERVLTTSDISGGGQTPWTSDIDGDGFTLEDAGYLFLRGQSAADPDVTGQGQIWVEEGATGDPLWSEVEILADMEGPDAATSYTEISVNAASASFFGTAQLDTAQFNSGTSSLLLDGNSDWITFPDIAAYDIGTASWTIEGFVRFNTLPPLQASTGPGYVLYDSRKAGSPLIQYGIIQDAFGYRVRLVGQDWGAELGTISGGISTGTWYHWAVTRDVGGDGNVRAYFNGNYETADFGVSPADLGNPDAAIIIGCRDATDAFHDGWIDDVRVTIGTARYAGTGSYSPPTTPYAMAPGPQGLFFVDDLSNSTDLLTGAASSLQATMAIGATTSIDLQIITGAALTIFDAADVDSVSVEINTTTMAPAEALVFIRSTNVEVYSFDNPINIDGGSFHVAGGTDGYAFYRYGDAVSSSIRNSTAGITLQVVGAGDIFRIQSDSIELSEASAPVAASAGYGQIWVRDDVPNNLAFTDDADEDFAVAYATGRETANATHDFNTAGNIAENFIGFYDDSAAYTVTLEDSTSVVNWPLHTAIQVLAPTVGAITIAEGSGTTLFLDDGTDTVGGGTLTQGVVTIYRTSTTDYYIWGSGFTP